MATSKEYMTFILDQLSGLAGITCRQMMGEYIVYHHGKIAAYLCDDRLLVKPVPSARRRLPQAQPQPPYPGAKEMPPVENVDDRAFLEELFGAMYGELPAPAPKKSKKKY